MSAETDDLRRLLESRLREQLAPFVGVPLTDEIRGLLIQAMLKVLCPATDAEMAAWADRQAEVLAGRPLDPLNHAHRSYREFFRRRAPHDYGPPESTP